MILLDGAEHRAYALLVAHSDGGPISSLGFRILRDSIRMSNDLKRDVNKVTAQHKN